MKNNEAFILFFSKEWKQLLGKRRINLIILSCICAIALLSIGFAIAGLSYLEKKMSDPFVTCVDIEVDQVWGDGFGILSEFIEADTNQVKMGFSNPEQVFLFRETFYSIDNKQVTLDGRTFSSDSPLKETAILSETNIIIPPLENIADFDFGLVLSKNALRKLGYPDDSIPSFLQQHVWLSNELEYHFNVPVLAVVKELPNMSDFLATRCYAQQEIAENAEHFDISKRDDDLIICYSGQFADSWTTDVRDVEIVDNQPYKWNSDLYQIRLRSKTAFDQSSRVTIYDSLFLEIQKRTPNALRLYDFAFDSNKVNDRDPQLYSCYFEKEELQDKVELFRSELDKETNYKLDMSKINNLKNLAHIQHIGKTLSYCITGISILFIVVFLYFLLNMHFQKIQRNIGTFKAFGVDNLTLYKIYILIVFCIITYSLLFAGVTSFAFEMLANNISPIEGTENRIDIFVWQNALLVALVYVCSFLSTFYVVHSKLRHTPGDLIYNRNQN